MYTIMCSRIGTYPDKLNKGYKGWFVKKFNTLSELANFIFISNKSLCFPNIRNELTKKEAIILSRKLDSLIMRN